MKSINQSINQFETSMLQPVIDPQPPQITKLIQLLHGTKIDPTQLEITILPDRIDGSSSSSSSSGTNSNAYDDSDYYFLKDGIHLGIHAPNVPQLARLFRSEFYSIRHLYKKSTRNMKKNVVVVVADDDNGNNVLDVLDNVVDVVDMNANVNDIDKREIKNRLGDATKCLLLLCPDHATAWSDRKRLLHNQCYHARFERNSMEYLEYVLSNVWQDEMNYLNLLFTQHSKAYVLSINMLTMMMMMMMMDILTNIFVVLNFYFVN